MDNPARYASLQKAISEDNASRKHLVMDLVQKIEDHKSLFTLISDLYSDPLYRCRVTHGDMKLNNILFKSNSSEVKAVIDLDTCMVGDYLFDYGDFMRIACSEASEDEKDHNKIQVNVDAVEATFRGIKRAHIDLCQSEMAALSRCGASLALTVGTRFLTDYLNGDRYFNVSYEDHNLIRAWNQVVLAERFLEKKNIITALQRKVFYE
jgi:thiamine kinase-like enzyme